MPEDILILEPGDERAQKIARAISSPTAGEILNQMKEGNFTASQLAESLDLPLTTVQYHIENLVGAAILAVMDKKWSKKGREIKVYGLRDQVVIVAPRPGDIRSLLLKYASLFAIVLLAGVVMLSLLSLLPGSGPATPPLLQKETGGEDTRMYAVPSANEIPTDNGYAPLLYFVLGGAVSIFSLAAYEFQRRRSLQSVPAVIPSRDE
jgi:DNA-binding transcriptional ArsR family regulator